MDVSSLLNGGPEGQWYVIPGYEEGDAPPQVKLCPVKPGIRDSFVRRHTKSKVKRGVHTEIFDWRAVNHDMLNAGVVEWRNISLGEGREYDCNRENKIALHDNWPEFNALWTKWLENQGELVDEIEEAEQGNS